MSKHVRENTKRSYIPITPWFRIILENGKYAGWYNPRLKKPLD